MRRVEQEAGRMQDPVEDLLLLAKLDEDHPVRRHSVRLDEPAADAVRDARAVDASRPITCHAEPVEIVGDDARLRQAHGGTAEVDAAPGAGARFRLRLPVHPTLAHLPG